MNEIISDAYGMSSAKHLLRSIEGKQFYPTRNLQRYNSVSKENGKINKEISNR